MPKELEIPDKLAADLRKTSPQLRAAFGQVCAALIEHCPAARCESHARYSAFYVHGESFAYIEPQTERVRFGFFKQDADSPQLSLSIRRGVFPEWNKSKGGLVAYDLQSVDPAKLRTEGEDIFSLLKVAYEHAGGAVA